MLHHPDQMDIYRTKTVTDGALTKQVRGVPVHTKIPCRLVRYLRDDAAKMSDTAAYEETKFRCICALDVDIQTGDEVHVTKGANMRRPPATAMSAQRFFAGKITLYTDVLPHKEVLLGLHERN